MKKNYLYIAFAISLFATVGSLFLSEVLHWQPCVLCWSQRIMIYPLVIILGASILKDIKDVDYIVLPMTFIGGLIAIYHNLLQYHIISEKLAPCSNGIPCVDFYHIGPTWLSVPLLSLITFIIITICMFGYRKEKV